MAMPSKSATALVNSDGLFASIPSGDVDPNTVLTSSGIRSNSMLAVENAPTSQPARVNATHGAGAVLPSSSAICGWPSAAAAVQYKNELWKPPEPSVRNQP